MSMKKNKSIVLGRLTKVPPEPKFDPCMYSSAVIEARPVSPSDALVGANEHIGLLTAEELVGCSMAIPHDDKHITQDFNERFYFLNLVVRSQRHVVGDILSPRSDLRPLEPGDLFVIDPMIYHWLSPSYSLMVAGDPGFFVVRQWTCTRKGLARVAKKLAGDWGFAPYDKVDKRYRYILEELQ